MAPRYPNIRSPLDTQCKHMTAPQAAVPSPQGSGGIHRPPHRPLTHPSWRPLGIRIPHTLVPPLLFIPPVSISQTLEGTVFFLNHDFCGALFVPLCLCQPPSRPPCWKTDKFGSTGNVGGHKCNGGCIPPQTGLIHSRSGGGGDCR